jgi:hypothetical protein
VSFSRLSTGTKLASKTQKKTQKIVRFRFSTGTKSSKTAQKNVKMYLVSATNLKKKKNLRLVAGTKYGVFRYIFKRLLIITIII